MFREDWEETKETLYTQKQGKHTRDRKETTILRVYLKSYIDKMASSKTDLKHLNDGEEIEICSILMLEEEESLLNLAF